MPVRDKKSSFCSPLQAEQPEKGAGEQEVLGSGARWEGSCGVPASESIPVEELSARFGTARP